MKKFFCNILLIALVIIPFSVKADGDTDGNGGAITGDTTIDVNTGIRISGNGDYGIRITVVDENGNIKSARTVDYWQSAFPSSTIKQMPGSTYKTAIVNGGGLSYSPLSSFGNYSYSTAPATHISGAGTGTWNNKHLTLQKMVDQAVNGDSCKNPEFLNDVGFDICKYVENNECEELKKIYILIEPLVRMHNNNGVYYVFSGTEAANYFAAAHAAGEISTDTYKNNFGGSVYRNLINMYLTNQDDDSLQYRLKSNGAIYAYFTSKPTSSNAGNEPSNRMDLFAGKTRDSNGNPWGSSMQLVWLGRAAKDCEPKECCIPCSVANVEGCDPDDCCYDEKLPVSTDGTTEACKPWKDYWNERGDFEDVCFPKCDPNTDPNGCCDDPDYLREHPGYYEQYCTEEKKCPIPKLKPEYVAPYCDEENGYDEDSVPVNTAYFRDGVFNSNGGQFSDYNKIEKIEPLAPYLPSEWIDRIVEQYKDNTFLAVAYREDSRYTTKVNDYCKMHCQEIFEVTLPENYPYVNAGRYFKWTIKGSESTIAKAADGKLCAVDIDLDKAIDTYVGYNQKAQSAASAAANLHCGSLPFYGLDRAGGAYNCNDYASQGKKIGVCCSIQCKKWQTYTYTCGCDAHGNGCHTCSARVCVEWETVEEAEARCYGSLLSECGKIDANYAQYVEGFAAKMAELTKSIEQCNSIGQEIDVDMGVELNYHTFFNDYSYSTVNPDEIEVTPGAGAYAIAYRCVDNEETDDCNKDEHKFVLSDRGHEGKNPYAIKCKNSKTTWNEIEKYPEIEKLGGPITESIPVYEPNVVYGYGTGMYYDFQNVTMINGIVGFDRNSGTYIGGDSFYTFRETWNTTFLGFISTSKIYELNEKINACTCKDGEIRNMEDDGTCSCTREVSYSNFINSGYNNYQTLPDGTLRVEFMNPTGLYPINLIYWTIGSVDENGRGHFDSILADSNVDGEGHDLCTNNECPDGEDCCIYDDPNGACRLKIKNIIIATPDNDGDCEEPPCKPTPDDNGRCEDEPCDDTDPDDTGDCVDENGNPTGNCEKSTDLNIIYRVIDLDNPFPGTDAGGRTPGVNWQGKEDVIKNNREQEGSAIYNSGVEPLYSMTLTPAIIKEIRAGNHRTDNLLGYTSSMMYPTGPAEPGGGYSLFLHRYLDGNLKIKYDEREQFNYIQKTGDGVK